MIRIRKARAGDVPRIARGQKELNRFHLRFDPSYYAPSGAASREFSAYLRRKVKDPDFFILVAEEGRTFLGYVLAWVERRPPLYRKRRLGYLSNIYVRPSRARSGLGTVLYTCLEDWFRKKKVDFIQARVHVSNSAALKSFKRWGLQELAVTVSKEVGGK
jgi:ribosomal protein S18 acetylase RimI-like enzyme